MLLATCVGLALRFSLEYSSQEFEPKKMKLFPQMLADSLGLLALLLTPCFWAISGALPHQLGVALATTPGSGPFHISSAFLGAP